MNRRRGFADLPPDILPPDPDHDPSRSLPDTPARALPVARRANMFSLPTTAELASNEILPANPRRAYLIIQNRSAASVYVNFGQSASAAYLEIIAGGSYEPLVAPVNSVHVVGAAGGQSIVVIEGSQA